MSSTRWSGRSPRDTSAEEINELMKKAAGVHVDPDELDVGSVREMPVALDPRPQPQQILAVRFPPEDRVRIADRHRRELDPFVAEVQCLHPSYLERADVELDDVAVDGRRHVPLADPQLHASRV